MAANANLGNAKKKKNDEFYTQITDIEKELRHYKEHFKGKRIFCNCDDPEFSNFWRYFELNFEHLELERLTSTHYDEDVSTYRLDMFRDENGILIKTRTPLEQNGDFRSPESIEILKESDIVVTNPPFSLFREYIAQIMTYEKNFIVLGNMNAITYKEVFPLIIENKIWAGTTFNKTLKFSVPEDYFSNTDERDRNGLKLAKVPGIAWLTNLDHNRRHEDLTLWKKYTPEAYPKYDNYDAIEVSAVKNIPIDYDGVMGVPITYLDKHNPDQFEIIGLTTGRKEFSNPKSWPTKEYLNAKQHNTNGTIVSGSKANTRSTILLNEEPLGSIYYTADNADGPLKIVYARILIVRKNTNSLGGVSE